VITTNLGIEAYKAYPEQERFRRAAHDVNDEGVAAMHLVGAMSLEKIRCETVPAPAKLNKKRERKGKVPFFEYKVLDIVADVMATPKERAGRPHGQHASPRMHKRRGHIRRLDTGRVTWVRPTIVGKPGRGIVEKSYNVHHGEPTQ
jgi:hypothetical protein